MAVQRGLTEAQAGSELTALAPIMAVEGRTMDEDNHQLLMQLLQKSITLADALDSIIRRRSGITETAPRLTESQGRGRDSPFPTPSTGVVSGDVAVTAAHPVGVRDLYTPMIGEPHFDKFGGGVGLSGLVVQLKEAYDSGSRAFA